MLIFKNGVWFGWELRNLARNSMIPSIGLNWHIGAAFRICEVIHSLDTCNFELCVGWWLFSLLFVVYVCVCRILGLRVNCVWWLVSLLSVLRMCVFVVFWACAYIGIFDLGFYRICYLGQSYFFKNVGCSYLSFRMF